MRKKHRRQLLITGVAYMFLFMNVNLPSLFAAASGNYTDLLPIGAAGNTTVISNGSGWSLTTLAPSQTFGDALSRAPMTVYQSTTPTSVNNTTAVTTFTAISGQGKVGSTTFPATWVAAGRSARITARGTYNTIAGNQSWVWGLNIGTTTIINSSTTVTASVATQTFSVSGIVTILATGNTGSVIGSYDVLATTAVAGVGNPGLVSNVISYSTSSVSTTVDLTSQLVVNPFFQWRAATQGNNITFSNVTVEFLN